MLGWAGSVDKLRLIVEVLEMARANHPNAIDLRVVARLDEGQLKRLRLQPDQRSAAHGGTILEVVPVRNGLRDDQIGHDRVPRLLRTLGATVGVDELRAL